MKTWLERAFCRFCSHHVALHGARRFNPRSKKMIFDGCQGDKGRCGCPRHKKGR